MRKALGVQPETPWKITYGIALEECLRAYDVERYWDVKCPGAPPRPPTSTLNAYGAGWGWNRAELGPYPMTSQALRDFHSCQGAYAGTVRCGPGPGGTVWYQSGGQAQDPAPQSSSSSGQSYTVWPPGSAPPPLSSDIVGPLIVLAALLFFVTAT